MTKRQKEELAKYCLDLSKVSVGTLGFTVFSDQPTFSKVILSLCGLTVGFIFLRMGMKLFKEL